MTKEKVRLLYRAAEIFSSPTSRKMLLWSGNRGPAQLWRRFNMFLLRYPPYLLYFRTRNRGRLLPPTLRKNDGRGSVENNTCAIGFAR